MNNFCKDLINCTLFTIWVNLLYVKLLDPQVTNVPACRAGIILAGECSVKIIAGIFDFYSRGRLERERNLYQLKIKQ